MLVCIGSDTWGDVGTLSLGELLEERVSVGRPNLLLKKGKSVSVRYGVTIPAEEIIHLSNFCSDLM